jgi:hypothetical protein
MTATASTWAGEEVREARKCLADALECGQEDGVNTPLRPPRFPVYRSDNENPPQDEIPDVW